MKILRKVNSEKYYRTLIDLLDCNELTSEEKELLLSLCNKMEGDNRVDLTEDIDKELFRSLLIKDWIEEIEGEYYVSDMITPIKSNAKKI